MYMYVYVMYNTYVNVYDLVGFLMKYVSVMSGNNSNIFPPNTVLIVMKRFINIKVSKELMRSLL